MLYYFKHFISCMITPVLIECTASMAVCVVSHYIRRDGHMSLVLSSTHGITCFIRQALFKYIIVLLEY